MADFQAMLAVNLLSAVTALPGRAAATCERSGFGRIVNIASTAGLKGYAYVTAYVAAKHALVGFTRALALETVKTASPSTRFALDSPTPTWCARSVATIAAAAGRSPQRGTWSNWRPAIPQDGWCGRRKSPKLSPSCAGATPAR